MVDKRYGRRAIAIVGLGGLAIACGVQSPNNLAEREQTVRALLGTGQYRAAHEAGEALAQALSVPDITVTQRNASALLAIIDARRLGGRPPDAVDLAARVVRGLQASRDPLALAKGIVARGQARLAAGQAINAELDLRDGLSRLELLQPGSGVARSDALDSIAESLIEQNRYEDAWHALARSWAIKESGAPFSPSAARTLDLQSVVLLRTGRYGEAREILERAIAIRRRHPEHADITVTLAAAGDLAWLEGRRTAAGDAYRECLRLAGALLPASHPHTAHCARRHALVLIESGDITTALADLERAAAMAQETLGADHPLFASYLNDLGEAHRTVLDFRKARQLYEQALRIRERHFGPDHDGVANIVYNLALVSSEVGDLDLARESYNRAAHIWTRRFGEDHPFVAVARGGLARTLRQHGRAVEALALQEQVVMAREQRLGLAHRDTAESIGELADILLALGQRARALDLSNRAISAWTTVGALDSPDFASALARHGDLLAAVGDRPAARRYYERALEILKRVFGPDHPNSASVQLGLASVDWADGRSTRALRQALDAEQNARRFVRATLRYLPEREGLSYAARRPSGLNLALSVLTEAPSSTDAGDVFATVVNTRALVFDEMAARQRLSAGAGTDTVRDSWVAARQRFANLAIRAAREPASRVDPSMLRDARREAERMERALAEKNSAFSVQQDAAEYSLADIANRLPSGAGLISFVKYDRLVQDEGPSANQPIPSYMAFVLAPSHPTATVVHLGAASELEQVITEWRRAAVAGTAASKPQLAADADYRRAAHGLKRRIWDPIARVTGDARQLFIVPDGAVHLVQFAALPVGESRYLLEEGPLLHYLTSERDLLHAPTILRTANLLALGGAAFGGQVPAVHRSADSGITTTGAGCDSLESFRFAALPGTHAEVYGIAARWEAPPALRQAHVLTGAAATERAFKLQARGHRVLHLATHGFFLGAGCDAVTAPTRGVGGLAGTSPSSPILNSPLLQVGLAFAGANRRSDGGKAGEEDGILTAEEVSSMNLDGVEWAVLSACDTGLGEIRAGEGVFGLRRAFQIAGARTVIMSLWQVDDNATVAWMRALYDGRLRRRLSTAEAVRDASLAVLRDRRARGESTHPFYWAAFIATGDWR